MGGSVADRDVWPDVAGWTTVGHMQREPRTVVVRTRMSVTDVEFLDALAEQWDCSRSDVVRRAVLRYRGRSAPDAEDEVTTATPVVAAAGSVSREFRPLSKTDQARGRHTKGGARS